uniref:Uncharacterized protein n=1 Tax=Anguilla anguilla TaxID=7936 RepID=A0A0E9X3R3_ANGAN
MRLLDMQSVTTACLEIWLQFEKHTLFTPHQNPCRVQIASVFNSAAQMSGNFH